MFQRVILPFLLVTALLAGVSVYFANYHPASRQTTAEPLPVTIVLDAGHGGEDGGTVSETGILEKELNLAVATRLYHLLQASGVPVVMTRTTDELLYDKNADYQGRKKALDLAKRRQIAEETPNAVFISIHMNSYPDARYSGLQVWYSPNNPASKQLANTVQDTVKKSLQPENNRQTKPATSAIYLLHNLTIPAILVECGFLSNPGEAQMLSTEEYQNSLALALFAAIESACRNPAITGN